MSWFTSTLDKISPGYNLFQKMRKDADQYSGKNLAKDAKFEQLKQTKEINKQKKIEKTKALEAESEINRRKLLSRQGYGMSSLMSKTLGG